LFTQKTAVPIAVWCFCHSCVLQWWKY